MEVTWYKISEKLPKDQEIVFISDGVDFGLAQFNAKYPLHPPLTPVMGSDADDYGYFSGYGFGGYEWDWWFDPAYWASCPIHLPQVPKKENT